MRDAPAGKVKRIVLDDGLQLAGFEVTPTGRFWVTPEERNLKRFQEVLLDAKAKWQADE